MEEVDDAAEEPVDENGIDAAIARCLGALDHHEHDGAAVHCVESAGERARKPFSENGEQHKRRYEKREEYAVGGRYVEAHVLDLPHQQQGDCRNERGAHGKDVDEGSDLGIADGERPHDAAAEAERTDGERAAPIVVQDLAVDARVSAGDVFEHRLVGVDGSAFQDNAQSEEGKEDERDQVDGDCAGNQVKREIEQRSVCSAEYEVAVARFGFLAGEQPLPQHVESGRPQSEQRSANHDERQSDLIDVDGADEAAPAEEVGYACRNHEESAGWTGEEVHAERAGEVAERNDERLGEEEAEHDFLRLKFHGQKREHAAPYPRCVDGEKQGVTQR